MRYCHFNSFTKTSSSSKTGPPGPVAFSWAPCRVIGVWRKLSKCLISIHWSPLQYEKAGKAHGNCFGPSFFQRGWSWCSGLGEQGGRAGLLSSACFSASPSVEVWVTSRTVLLSSWFDLLLLLGSGKNFLCLASVVARKQLYLKL